MTESYSEITPMMGIFLEAAPEGGPGITHEQRDSGEGTGSMVDWLVHRNEEEEITAMLIIRADGPAKGMVHGFVVPKFQRQGIATLMWNYGVENFGLRPEDQITTPDADAFFESLDTAL